MSGWNRARVGPHALESARCLAMLFVVAAVGSGLVACGVEDGSAPAGSPLASSGSAEPNVGRTDGASDADVASARLASCPPSDQQVAPRADGLPDVTLLCLGAGPSVRLAGLRGTPTVINIWASWCGPCVSELPMMGEVAGIAGGRVRFLGIDMADDRIAGLKMAGSSHMGFASVQDPRSEIRAGLRIVGTPTTLFVRADGSIAGRTTGPMPDATELRSQIDRYLGVKVA